MAKYLYILALGKVLDPEQLVELRNELGTVFQSGDVTIVRGKEAKLNSPLSPMEIEAGLRGLTAKFGPVEIRAGSKLD